MITRTRIIVGLVILLSIASVGLVAAVMVPSAEELLTQALETLETTESGYAVIEVDAAFQGESLDGKFKVWAKLDVGPNGEPAARIEVINASKPGLAGLTAVSDGSQFWLYDPDRNTVVVGQAEEMAAILVDKLAEYEGQIPHDGQYDPDKIDIPETPAEAVAKLQEYVTLDRQATEALEGGDATLLRLVPIPEQMPDELRAVGGFINLWLRTSDQLPLAAEFAQSAAGSFRIEATELEINSPLEEGIFTFDIPDGAQILEAVDLLAEMEARTNDASAAEPVEIEPLTATEVPEGAVAAAVEQFGGQVVQRYDWPDGRSFVVAQGAITKLDEPAEATRSESVTVRGVDGTLFANEDDTRVLLGWIEGETLFVVAGDLSSELALALAESLK